MRSLHLGSANDAVCLTQSNDFVCHLLGLQPSHVELVTILWMAQHDPDPATAEGALDIWEDCSCQLPDSFLSAILKHLCSDHADIRVAAAEALGFGLQVGVELWSQSQSTMDGMDSSESLPQHPTRFLEYL